MSTKTFTQFRVDNVVTTEPTTLQYGKEVYYKDPNGVMTLYVGDENGNAQRALPLATPARKIYVFGGADNSFPYFSSFANALTYANSLTPSTTNPVSIVLLSQNDGTPFMITGADDWYALCLDGIYVSSPYREIFSTTTLPTTLPKGMRVMYVDSNGTESLWVGNADGVAWPAVGYKEYTVLLNYSAPTLTVTTLKNEIGNVVWARSGVGIFLGTLNGAFTNSDWGTGGSVYIQELATFEDGESRFVKHATNGDVLDVVVWVDEVVSDTLVNHCVSIRIYP